MNLLIKSLWSDNYWAYAALFGYYSESFCSTVFAMLLVQHLFHAFSCEKAYYKHSVSRITYGKDSNFSRLEVNTIKLSLVTVNKPWHTDTIYAFIVY